MNLFKRILVLALLSALSISIVEARHGGGHGGHRGGGRHRGGGHHHYHHGGRGGYGYGGWGYGGAVAGGVIAGTALGYAASRGYNDYEGEYTSYPVNYNNTYVTQQPVDDAMDIE